MKRRTVWIIVGAVALLIVAVVTILTLLGPQLGKTPILVCTVMGCEDGFAVRFTGSIPSDYSVEVTGSEDYHFSTTCHHENGAVTGESCMPWGGLKIRTTSPEVTVTVHWTGGSKTQVFRPDYQTWQPNGPGCTPTCKIGGELTMSLP